VYHYVWNPVRGGCCAIRVKTHMTVQNLYRNSNYSFVGCASTPCARVRSALTPRPNPAGFLPTSDSTYTALATSHASHPLPIVKTQPI